MKLTPMFDYRAEVGKQNTPPGMAHWIGSGPKGKTCRQCLHWQSMGEYYAGSRGIKPAKCGKYREFAGIPGKPVRHSAAACKHFETHPDPYPVHKK